MGDVLENKIEELETEANQLIGQAGFAMRNAKGFAHAVELIKKNIAVMREMNQKIDDIIEITKNQGVE